MKKFVPLSLLALVPVTLLPLSRAQETGAPQSTDETAGAQQPADAPQADAPKADSAEGLAPREGRLSPRPAPGLAPWDVPIAPVAPSAPGVFLGIRMSEDGPRTVVEEVVPGSPAEAAGLAAGDRLLSVAGRPVAGAASVIESLGGYRPGQTVAVEVLRGDVLQRLEAELAPRPENAAAPRAGGPRAAPRLEPVPAPGFAPNTLPPGVHEMPDMLRSLFGGGAGMDPLGGFDMRGWLGDQERQAEKWQSELESRFRDLRVDLEREFEALRREFEGQVGSGGPMAPGGVGRGWMRSESRELRAADRPAEIPAEAWADLEARLAPLEQQRQKIAREWAEAQGHPEWADAVPKLGVEVRIERREVQSGS
ncbi:MAG: PDZ domain-containing protein [Planctomycetaceae bacterium]|nr:PDZ domain-containing protein [Planctomycetaceae bacterium]